MLKEIFLAIQDQLATQVKDLRYIDENWGQIDSFDIKPVQYPCALIAMNNIQWNNAGKLHQEGLLTITISIAEQKLTRSSAQAPNTQKQQAFAIHDLLRKIHLSLHGFQPTPFTTMLIRTYTQRIQHEDGIQEYLISYTCQVYEDHQPQQTTTIHKIDLQPSL